MPDLLSLKMLGIFPSCSCEAAFYISTVGEAERSRKTKAAGMSLSCWRAFVSPHRWCWHPLILSHRFQVKLILMCLNKSTPGKSWRFCLEDKRPPTVFGARRWKICNISNISCLFASTAGHLNWGIKSRLDPRGHKKRQTERSKTHFLNLVFIVFLDILQKWLQKHPKQFKS